MESYVRCILPVAVPEVSCIRRRSADNFGVDVQTFDTGSSKTLLRLLVLIFETLLSSLLLLNVLLERMGTGPADFFVSNSVLFGISSSGTLSYTGMIKNLNYSFTNLAILCLKKEEKNVSIILTAGYETEIKYTLRMQKHKILNERNFGLIKDIEKFCVGHRKRFIILYICNCK